MTPDERRKKKIRYNYMCLEVGRKLHALISYSYSYMLMYAFGCVKEVGRKLYALMLCYSYMLMYEFGCVKEVGREIVWGGVIKQK